MLGGSGWMFYLNTTSVNGTIHDGEFGVDCGVPVLKRPFLKFKYVSNDKYEVEVLNKWDHPFTASNGVSLLIVPNSA
jgi:hypothetical protein